MSPLRVLLVLGLSPALAAADSNATITKLADANGGNAMVTWSKVADGTASLMKELIGGKTPNALDIATAFVPMLAGAIDPLLGAAAGYVLSFLGAFFNKGSGALAVAMKQQQLVSNAIMQDKIMGISGWLEDATGSSNFWTNVYSGNSSTDKTSLQVFLASLELNLATHKHEIFGDCMTDLTTASCFDWEASGTISLQLFFAHFHLQSLVSNANSYAGDAAKVKEFAENIRETGTQYLSLLNHALETFSKSRMLAVQKPMWNMLKDCSQTTPGDSLCQVHGGVDSFLGSHNYLNDCHIPGFIGNSIVQSKSGPVFTCHDDYMSKLSAEIAQLETQKNLLQKIVDVTPAISVKTKGTHTSANGTLTAAVALGDIDYCANADSWDWCDWQTGATGLWVWPQGDDSKKQAITLDQCYPRPVAIARLAVQHNGCVQWQCYGQKTAKSTCVTGNGDLFMAFQCQEKGLLSKGDTGRLCWARGVDGKKTTSTVFV